VARLGKTQRTGLPWNRRGLAVVLAGAALGGALIAFPALGGANAGSASGGKRVLVEDDFFNRKTVTVPRGAKVTWVVKGVDGHTVTFRKVPGGVRHIKGTGTLDQGARFSHVFSKRGTYRYICRFHVAFGMRGTVVVK
jgi:plastocyanin